LNMAVFVSLHVCGLPLQLIEGKSARSTVRLAPPDLNPKDKSHSATTVPKQLLD
jgi:hypothetical protein